MGSDLEDDQALHSSSFLSPQMRVAPTSTSSVATPPKAVPNNQPAVRPEADDVETQHDANADDEDDDDEDERPRDVPRAREVNGSANPFASSSANARAPPFGATMMPQPTAASSTNPFAQFNQQQQPQPHAVPPPTDEYLCVSNKCRARHCFRMQWEAEVNPRCREKTALNVEGRIYLFDGFYILCHDDMPDVPQFEYTREGVMCRIHFVREALPQALLPPSELGNPAISSSHGCATMQELKRYLFKTLLGIQTMHLFQSVFGDPSSATGDAGDYCSDFHLIPRFISVSDSPLVNREDLLASHRIGFAVGKFLQIDHVLGCLGASAEVKVDKFLETIPPRAIVDTVVSTRINGVPGLFRVDGLVFDNIHEAPSSLADDATSLPAEKKHPQLKHLKHAARGAQEYDGIDSRKKLRKWQELGRLVQVSPFVGPHEQLLNPADCHLTGMRPDIFEVGSAMPMVLKYMRHYKLLASFERDMKLQFQDKTLLRQAFTHGSYVDAAMQSVNTVEATISRVRLGHVFENTESLKRDRSAFMGEQSDTSTKAIDAEMKRVTEQHLTTDFKPEFNSKYLCPYERLEFLGDAVLSFLVATSSFLKLPHSDGESVLHETRKEITNNAALGRVARDANFDVLMLTAYDLAQLKDDATSKIAADCMEALLGAVYTDQGIDACRRLLLELMERYDPNVRELYLLDKDEIIEKATAYTEMDRDRFKQWDKARETRLTHHRFTTKTNVVIRNTHLWLQTVTHGSFKAPQIDDGEFLCTDASYERIEFLGDAVLQLLSSEFLVDALPNYQEHLLTQARSSLVKNTRLAVVAGNAGYEEFIRLGNLVKQNGGLYTEDVLADVFEATLGAVFLENPRDLNKVRSILQQTLFPLLTEAIRRREWMNPEKKLAHYLAMWSRSSKVQCHFKKLPAQMGNEHCVAVWINGFRVAHGSGRTIHEAKNRACKKALYLYGVGLAK